MQGTGPSLMCSEIHTTNSCVTNIVERRDVDEEDVGEDEVPECATSDMKTFCRANKQTGRTSQQDVI